MLLLSVVIFALMTNILVGFPSELSDDSETTTPTQRMPSTLAVEETSTGLASSVENIEETTVTYLTTFDSA